jgi:hypothetical protein
MSDGGQRDQQGWKEEEKSGEGWCHWGDKTVGTTTVSVVTVEVNER